MKNTVKITQLDKVQKIYQQIQKLDKECIQLEKLSEEVCTDNCNIQFDLKVFNFTKNPENKVKFDEDGSIISNSRSSSKGLYEMMLSAYTPTKQEPDKSVTISSTFLDTECLLIIGALLKVRYNTRDNLINQLKEIGIKI